MRRFRSSRAAFSRSSSAVSGGKSARRFSRTRAGIVSIV
jgi:hypothetical protein